MNDNIQCWILVFLLLLMLLWIYEWCWSTRCRFSLLWRFLRSAYVVYSCGVDLWMFWFPIPGFPVSHARRVRSGPVLGKRVYTVLRRSSKFIPYVVPVIRHRKGIWGTIAESNGTKKHSCTCKLQLKSSSQYDSNKNANFQQLYFYHYRNDRWRTNRRWICFKFDAGST